MNDKDNDLNLDDILDQYSTKKSNDLGNDSESSDIHLDKDTKTTNNEYHKSSDTFNDFDDQESDFKFNTKDSINENLDLQDGSFITSDYPSKDNEDLTRVSDSSLTAEVDLSEITSKISIAETQYGTRKKATNKQRKNRKKPAKTKKSKANKSIFVALIVVAIVLTVSFTVAVLGINLGMEYLGVGKKDAQITINIPPNSSVADISKILKDNGLIENEFLFKVIVKLKDSASKLMPGDVTLNPMQGYDSIIANLSIARDSYDQVTITFQEGLTLYEVAKLLEENNVCEASDFLFNFNSENFGYEYESSITTSAKKYYKFEGFLFPNTYKFYIDDSAYNVTKNLREETELVFDKYNLYDKIKKSDFTIEEVFTLASIVQAEAANVEDMKLVASVFINRLNNKDQFPKLQSDATKKYYTKFILPQNDDVTSQAMYEEAYDTYISKGLTPSPIGNPGIDAILAVIEAPKTDYYYFCSDINTKECFFAETFTEHKENLKKAGINDEKYYE